MAKSPTFYTSFMYSFVGTISLIKLGLCHPITLVGYTLFVTSILYHNQPYTRENKKLRFIDVFDRIMAYSITLLFFCYYGHCKKLWVSTLYTIIIFFLILKSNRITNKQASLFHSSIHILTGLTGIYLICYD